MIKAGTHEILPKIGLDLTKKNIRTSLYNCLEKDLSNYASLSLREKMFVLSLLRTNLYNQSRKEREMKI